MATSRKGIRLTDNPKDYMLRVRMDKDTLNKLDSVCELTSKTRSEIVRISIEEQYQKTQK